MRRDRSFTLLIVAALLINLLTPLLNFVDQAHAQSQRVVFCENPPAKAPIYENGFLPGWRAGTWDSDVQISPGSTVQVLPGQTNSLRAIITGESGASGVEFHNPNYRSAGHNRFSFFAWDPSGSFANQLSIAAYNDSEGTYGIHAKFKYESPQVVGGGWRYASVNLNQLTFNFNFRPDTNSPPTNAPMGINKIAIINESDVTATLYLASIAFDWHQGYAMGACISGGFGDGSFVTIDPKSVRPGDTILIRVSELPGADLKDDQIGLACSQDDFRTFITQSNNAWLSLINISTTSSNAFTMRVPDRPLLRSGDKCRVYLWDQGGNEFIAFTQFTLS